MGYNELGNWLLSSINLLKLTDKFTYQKFENSNIPLCDHMEFVCFNGFRNKHQFFSYTRLQDWFFTTEVESVYSAVRTESLYNTDTFRVLKVKTW